MLTLYRFEHPTKSLYVDNIDFLRTHDMFHNDEDHLPGIIVLKRNLRDYFCFPDTNRYLYGKYLEMRENKVSTDELNASFPDNFKDQVNDFAKFESRLKYYDNIRHLFNSKEIILKWFTRANLEAMFKHGYKLFEYDLEINFDTTKFQMLDKQTMLDNEYLLNCIEKREITI